ncbi:MAG: leucine-rich repeat protein, partial [Bacillota bacterium]|nr:leucine-rich repeat protein [Bacillota bacterium]
SIGAYAFFSCFKLTSIKIPESVTSIGNCAFAYCNSLISITIPSSVASIGNYAFDNCSNLTSISIPSSVTSIGFKEFYNCSSLTNITIPNSVTNIGNFAFDDCSSLTSITISSNATSIGAFAFGNCSSLTSLIIPSSVTSIGGSVFDNCSKLTSITIPSNVTSIGCYAFDGCSSLTSINADANNTAYSSLDGVLYNKLKTTLISYPAEKTNSTFVILSSVTSIADNAFGGCSRLTNITIPNSVTSIADNAFRNCSSLTSIIIPSSVTSIGDYAFLNCSSNLIIYYHNTAIGFTNPWNGYKTIPYNIVSYNGNGNTGGTVPVDNNIYTKDSKAVILKNTGNLVKTGYTFSGWNTKPDGSGIGYPAGTSVSMNGADITLYAQWMSISPSSGTFTKTAPANLTAVITAPNKANNPVIGVYNGTTRLIAGTDQAIVPTTTGYTFTLYKSYLSKLTSNTVITLKFRDGSSINYTVNIK